MVLKLKILRSFGIMSKNILIDTTNTNETRIAVTEDDKLDDFEIELNKNVVKGDVYLAKITRIEPSLQAAFVDFGTNRNGFLPLTEIHPDYFKIPAADEKKIKELSDNIFNTNNEDEIIDNEKNVNDDAIDDEAAIEVNEGSDSDNNKIYTKKNKKISPKKAYFNFFRKYKIQDVIRPRQVILVQINKEERGLKRCCFNYLFIFAGRYCV